MKRMIIAVWCMLAAASAWGQNQTFGDWNVDASSGAFDVARTFDSRGNIAGVICFPPGNKCIPYIITDKTCNPQDAYPMMINSSIGASSVTGVCEKIGKVLILSFANSDASAVISAFESGGGMVGFAFPLKDGEFISYRFSTSGSTLAIAAAQTAAASQAAPAKPATTPQVF